MRNKSIYLTIILLFSSCAVRDTVNRIDTKLDRIEASNMRVEDAIQQLDSLTNEEIELIIRFRAEQTATLIQFREDIESTRNAINELSGVSVTQKRDTSLLSDVYSIAYSDYLQGNYDLALSGFLMYIKSVPNLDETRYLLGACYYEKNDFLNAIKSLLLVIQDYPDSKRTPSAIYKIGRIHETMGDTLSANQYFEMLLKDYHDSEEAKLLIGSEK
ncbi:tetratricopeptide repeat protein [candidate division WOR-3 bacterium]|nr:tetratricopeptide repeat protein [candidate division WOR-3 bacterium]